MIIIIKTSINIIQINVLKLLRRTAALCNVRPAQLTNAYAFLCSWPLH